MTMQAMVRQTYQREIIPRARELMDQSEVSLLMLTLIHKYCQSPLFQESKGYID